jgi:hypothetical protein
MLDLCGAVSSTQAQMIVYKKHVGSAVPWSYVLGWANHVVVPEQPDLVLLYGIGLESDLEKIFQTLRRHTTADIIVASVHWKTDDIKNWGQDEDVTKKDRGEPCPDLFRTRRLRDSLRRGPRPDHRHGRDAVPQPAPSRACNENNCASVGLRNIGQ